MCTCPEVSQGGHVQPSGLSIIYHAAGCEAGIMRCTNLAIYIRDCEALCLSDETVNAVGPFYLASMPGEVKYPTQGVNV